LSILQIDPLADKRWDDFIQKQPGGTIFHHSAWARVLQDRYGAKPTYFAKENGNGEITAVAPFFKISGALGERRLVCLPASEYTIANSTLTRLRIRDLERQGGKYDAAYFFQNTIITLLWGLRRRIPHIIGMDGTPLWYRKNKLWYEHGDFDPEKPVERLKWDITRRVYAGARYLLPLSNSVRTSLIEDYRIAPEKVIVTPPGIDLNTYRNPDRSHRPAGRAKKVLFVGADFLRKGGEMMLALAKREEFSAVEFHLVTKDYKGAASPNVTIHSDVSSDSAKMLALLEEADLFVLPTKADSHSIAALEAMAMGLPVIVSKVGGIEDIIVPGETGFFASADDLTRLGGQMRQLLDDDAGRLQMGRNARTRVEEKFNLAKNVDLVVSLLKEAALSRRGHVPAVARQGAVG
jgi:glycosyltransferase involved in cell wall biosynthesis